MNSLNPISAVGIDHIIGAHFNREPSQHVERGQAGAQDNESTMQSRFRWVVSSLLTLTKIDRPQLEES
jgi:hypothetical protein